MKIKFLFIVSVSILLSASAWTTQGSIAQQMNYYENIVVLTENKFTVNQFHEISEALSKLDEKIRIVSYNMLFNIYDKKLPAEHRWENRKGRLVELIRTMDGDIIGSQELFQDQIHDLLQGLKGEYAFTGGSNYRGDQLVPTETSGIFYRKSRFELLDLKVKYLSATPGTPSGDPFSPSCRALNIATFKDLKTGKIFCVLNSHTAFSSADSREFSARIIAKTVEEMGEGVPVVVTGDMNTFAARLDLEKLPFYDGNYILKILTSGRLKDSYHEALLGHIGPISTFTNKSDSDPTPFMGVGTPGIILDHIFVSDPIQVIFHATESGTVDGHFPSDHMPVIADIIMP